MTRQALNHAVGRQWGASLCFLPGQDLFLDLGPRQVELPFDQLHGHQPMIAAFGQPDFRQLGVEPLFAKAVGGFDPPTVNNRLVPVPGGDDLFRFAVVSQIPMRFWRMLALGVNPRADQLNRGQAAFLAQAQTTPQL